MTEQQIRAALGRLCDQFVSSEVVEIFLVGGAAGMLTGVFPAYRMTFDCDVMVCSPDHAIANILAKAAITAKQLGLDESWLNATVQGRLDSLPDGWEKRRVLICQGKWLAVFAASRSDLLAMKILAGRHKDVLDVEDMKPRAEDIRFVEAFLESARAKGVPNAHLEDAWTFLRTIKVQE